MGYHFAYHTDIGKRESNQDSLVIKSYSKNGKKAFLAAVCDGLGGLSRGEVNSRKAAQILSNWFEGVSVPVADGTDRPEYMEEQMEMLLRTINRSLFNDNRAAGSPGGTTMSALLLWNGERFIAHIGDSRIYEIRNGEVRQLTRDHSYVAREVELGHMTEAEAKVSKKRNVLLQCLGAKPFLDEPQVGEDGEEAPAVYLLGTDGFWHYMEQDYVLECLSPEKVRPEEMKQCLVNIVRTGREKGEKDNATAVVVLTDGKQ